MKWKVHNADTEVILTLCRGCLLSLIAVMNRQGPRPDSGVVDQHILLLIHLHNN